MSAKIAQLPLGPLQTNCYILACDTTNSAAVIDPGWAGNDVAGYVERQGWTISHILLTHAHFDHVGGLADLAEICGAPVYAHADALPMLAESAERARILHLELRQPDVPDHLIVDGQSIHVGDLDLSVLFTPGHAPGHVSYYLAEENVVFDGDVLFNQGIGRTDFPDSDYDTLMDSIREKLLTLPDETTVLSGHGPATTIGAEKRDNPFLK